MSTAAILQDSGPGHKYHHVAVTTVPRPVPKAGEALVAIEAVALNHRDLYILAKTYPNIEIGSVLGSDAVGRIVELNGDSDRLNIGDRVVVMPSLGWISDPRGPEDEATYALRGGSNVPGVFSQYLTVRMEDLFKAPEHLTQIEAAGLPLAGLTAYRALFTKGQVAKGQNVLVTGIGGGVALFALQYAAAVGANVYVTSSDEAKIERAKQYGAKGGVNYRQANWAQELLGLTNGRQFDVVIDSAMGPNSVTIMRQLLRLSGVFVVFGNTVGPFEIGRELFIRQIEYKGTTMGSRVEFEQMLDFVARHDIRPVVGNVFQGLETAPEAFQHLRDAKHFGKVVIVVE